MEHNVSQNTRSKENKGFLHKAKPSATEKSFVLNAFIFESSIEKNRVAHTQNAGTKSLAWTHSPCAPRSCRGTNWRLGSPSDPYRGETEGNKDSRLPLCLSTYLVMPKRIDPLEIHDTRLNGVLERRGCWGCLRLPHVRLIAMSCTL